MRDDFFGFFAEVWERRMGVKGERRLDGARAPWPRGRRRVRSWVMAVVVGRNSESVEMGVCDEADVLRCDARAHGHSAEFNSGAWRDPRPDIKSSHTVIPDDIG